jgi:hypothetical protein
MSFLSQSAALRKRRDALSDGPAESGRSLRTEAERSEVPGNRKEEARGGGASQSRTHFPSRVRRNLKPPGGRNRERTTAKLASRTSDREPEFGAERPRRKEPARDPKPAARQGAEPAGTGTGSAMILRRNLRDRPGPQGLGRNLPGKGGSAFTGRTNGPRDSGGRQKCRPPFRYGPLRPPDQMSSVRLRRTNPFGLSLSKPSSPHRRSRDEERRPATGSGQTEGMPASRLDPPVRRA